MIVIKRNGQTEEVSFDKVIRRIKQKCLQEPKCLKVDYVSIAQKVCARIYHGVKTSELDELSANICVGLSTDEPEYGQVASRIIVSNNHKNTPSSFRECIEILYNNTDNNEIHNPLISNAIYTIVCKHYEEIENKINYNRDYMFSYFGFKVLEGSYLKKIGKKIIERPQHMFMRVALGIHLDNVDNCYIFDISKLELAYNTYEYMSLGYFIHATPTLFNAGTPNPSLLSCFLLGMDDSITGIYKCLGDCAQISKGAGGIGFNISNIRSKDSYIHGTDGHSNGIIPMLRVFNNTALYVNQCFHPDTIIYTHLGPKRALNISINDKVVTIDGSFKSVLQIIKNNVSKDLYVIKTLHNICNTQCTGEHQIYTIKTSDAKLSIHTLLDLKNKGVLLASYTNASELKVGDLVCYPIPKYSTNTCYDNKYMRFYGIWISNGCDIHGNVSINLPNSAQIANTLQFIKDFFTENNINFHISEKHLKKIIQIKWDENKFRIFKDNDRNRTFINPKYFNNSKDNIIQLLKGIMENRKKNTRNVNIKIGSYLFACSIKLLFLTVGYLLKGYRDNNKNFILNVPLWEDFFEKSVKIKTTRNKDFVEENGLIWSRIKTIRIQKYRGDVYDFNIEDNHNYLTEMGLVHNSGKRNGSFAAYIEPWHADIYDFLEIKKNHGDENSKCRDLFMALWIPDIFMQRVASSLDWSLMDPAECPGLTNIYGDEFNRLYLKYEAEGKFRTKVSARNLWNKILESQIETGVPYICYKDSINNKSNQKNLGTIMNSNLCSEIAEYSDSSEYACCTLASLGLPAFVSDNKFDFDKLMQVVKTVVYNLNRIIDINKYPVPETEKSNLRHRPLGIGVQGLSDVYMRLGLPFDSESAAKLNREIFATIYYAALDESHNLATIIANNYISNNIEINSKMNNWDSSKFQKRIHANETWLGAYSSFEGSPISQGIFQFDMWGITPIESAGNCIFNWENLRNKIMKDGIRNSLLVAPMPTASTSQILGYNECFEPITSNIYVRRVLAGEFIVINNYLITDLQKIGLWNKSLKEKVILNNGSIQNITEIPKNIRDLYKTSWDISMKNVIDQSADRGAYICQTQSLNLFIAKPDFKTITNMHFYGWKKGLKTGIYYLRTQAAAKAQQITIDPNSDKKNDEIKSNEGGCLMCSS
jgi:ribonucleotide reductase alpha subunit/intein/homing endonuclease